MNFQLNEDHLVIRDAARDFADNVIKPKAKEIEFGKQFPMEMTKALAEQGFLGIIVPEQYGGAGLDNLSYVLVSEEIARVSTSLSMTVGLHNSLYQPPLLKWGTEDQKKKFLTPTATGEKFGAFALSEAGSGSDAAAMRTTAIEDGDDFLLTGTKLWITNGAVADFFLVFARLGDMDPVKKHRNICCFIVEKGMKGFVVGKNEDKMGINASPTNEISLDQVRVPKENLLGPVGDGFKIALSTLDGGRAGVAAQATGLCQAAFEEGTRYSLERKQFDQPISNFQMIQSHIAEMAVLTETSRLLVHRCAWLKDQNLPCTKESAIAKLFATEAATKVTHRAIQIHGGNGYSREYNVERLYRDARVMEIFEGTNEIQRIVIARSVLQDFSGKI